MFFPLTETTAWVFLSDTSTDWTPEDARVPADTTNEGLRVEEEFEVWRVDGGETCPTGLSNYL